MHMSPVIMVANSAWLGKIRKTCELVSWKKRVGYLAMLIAG